MCGAFILVIVSLAFILQLLGKLCQCVNLQQSDNQVHELNELLEEENTIQITGCIPLLKFLIPCKKHWVNVICHSLVAGGMAFCVTPIFNPLNDHIPKIVIQIFSWYSVMQAFYSLVIISPPEAATFRVQDSFGLQYLTRPMHVILASTLIWIDHGLVQCVGYGILMTLPLIWFLGLLPPFEVLSLWIIEQCQIFLFGGTASISVLRTILQFVISLSQIILVGYFVSDVKIVMIISAVCGYFLSLDFFGLFTKQFWSRQINENEKKTSVVKSPKSFTFSQSRTFKIKHQSN